MKKTKLADVLQTALDSVTELPWFESFHVGKHTDRHGREHEFSQADLEQMVSNFVPNTVPFVISHPEADTPAYGYAKEIKLTDDGKLYLSGDQVNVDFAKSVLTGSYGRRSLGIRKNEQNNWYIDHVAFLGAQAPALNLQPVGEYKFSKADEPIELEFSIETQTANVLVNFLRKLRDHFLATEGEEKANKIVDQWDVDWLLRQLAQSEVKDHLEPDYLYSKQDPLEDDVKTFTQAELDAAVKEARQQGLSSAAADFSKRETALSSENATLKQQNEQLLFSQKLDKHKDWVSTQIKAGKLLPAQAQGLAEFMAHIESVATDNAATFEFSQGKGDKAQTITKSPIEFMKSLITANKAHGLTDDLDEEHENNAEFSARDTGANDELNAQILQYSKKHNVSYIDAFNAIQLSSGG